MLLYRLRKIHSKRGIKWIYKRYFQRIDGYKWTFYYDSSQNKKVLTLARHAKVKIKRHIKIKQNYSVFDGNLEYWVNRLKKIPDISNTKLKLLTKQKSRCTICSQKFKYSDIMEIDHIVPLFKNGKRIFSNIQLVHKHCHRSKTRQDRFGE